MVGLKELKEHLVPAHALGVILEGDGTVLLDLAQRHHRVQEIFCLNTLFQNKHQDVTTIPECFDYHVKHFGSKAK